MQQENERAPKGQAADTAANEAACGAVLDAAAAPVDGRAGAAASSLGAPPAAAETPANQADPVAAAKARASERRRHQARRLTGWTRMAAIIPAAGLFIAAVALALGTLAQTLHVTIEFAAGNVPVSSLPRNTWSSPTSSCWPWRCTSWRWAC